MDKEPIAPCVVLTARYGCKMCGGEGVVRERHPYGSTTATETLDCDCVFEGCSEALLEMIESGPLNFRVEAHPAWENDMQHEYESYYERYADND